MTIKLLLSVLALVFTAQAFSNDMFAHLRVNLENGIALDPAAAKITLRQFNETGAPTLAVIGAVQNEDARMALTKIREEATSMTPYRAQGLLREALLETYVDDNNLPDQLIATLAAYMIMWEFYSRWMVNNAEMICPASYSAEQCEMFRLK